MDLAPWKPLSICALPLDASLAPAATYSGTKCSSRGWAGLKPGFRTKPTSACFLFSNLIGLKKSAQDQ